jgi:hypothetical protein
LSALTINFGETKINTEKSLFVLLSNAGNADLVITDIKRTSGTDEFGLKYAIPFPLTIRKSDPARSVIFAFNAKTPGEKHADFTFFSNDPANPAAVLRLQGTGVVTTAIASDQIPDVPLTYALFQNYPNPFSQIPRVAGNPETVIGYELPKPAPVRLSIYNATGQEIVALVDEYQSPGVYAVQWDGKDRLGRNLASGIYFYRLHAGDFVQTRKLAITR